LAVAQAFLGVLARLARMQQGVFLAHLGVAGAGRWAVAPLGVLRLVHLFVPPELPDESE
jgi:hypothetical protein